MPADRFERPRGYTTAPEWVAAHPGAELRPIFPETHLQIPLPHGHDKPVHWRFRALARREMPPGFVAVIPSGVTWGRTGAVVTPDGFLLADLSKQFMKPPAEHEIFRREPLPDLRDLEGSVAVIATKGGHGYYHWMLEVLPRLGLLAAAGIDVDYYVANFRDLPFQRETLARARIATNRVLSSSDDQALRAARMVVPSLTSPESDLMPGWAVRFLKSLFPERGGSRPGGERLYITRKRAGWRRVLNEDEIWPVLSRYGFREAIVEEMPVCDQAALFAGAEAVVAPHGAGLTNLAFARTGMLVVELFSPLFVNVCYWTLSHQAGLSYAYLLGDGQSPPEGSPAFSPYEDLIVSPDRLDMLLRAAGLG